MMPFSNEQFWPCEKSSSKVWMTNIEDLEINIPGMEAGPSASALRYLNEIFHLIEDAKAQAESLLKEFARSEGEWWPDALVIYELPGLPAQYGFAIEYSNESDRYGLWSVGFDRFCENKHGTLTRRQQ